VGGGGERGGGGGGGGGGGDERYGRRGQQNEPLKRNKMDFMCSTNLKLLIQIN